MAKSTLQHPYWALLAAMENFLLKKQEFEG